MEKKLLTDEEAAKYLKLSAGYLRVLRCKGGGPLFARLGRAIRYRITDLDAWIEARIRQNTLEA